MLTYAQIQWFYIFIEADVNSVSSKFTCFDFSEHYLLILEMDITPREKNRKPKKASQNKMSGLQAEQPEINWNNFSRPKKQWREKFKVWSHTTRQKKEKKVYLYNKPLFFTAVVAIHRQRTNNQKGEQ